MTSRIFYTISLSLLAAVSLLDLYAQSAEALTLTSSSGTWGVPTGDDAVIFQYQSLGVEFGNGLENQVRWGAPVEGLENSGLGFTGVGQQIFNPGDLFSVGTLRHFNNPILLDTGASAAPLTVSLSFSDPAIASTFDFNFLIDETINQPSDGICVYGDTIPCGDRITFQSAFSPQTFLIGATEYTLQLIGFTSAEGSVVDGFFSDENNTNSATLLAQITTPPTPSPDPVSVPEPVSTLGLLTMGALLLWTRR